MEEKIIFETNLVIVKACTGFKSKTLIVTFDCYNQTGILHRSGFGEGYFKEKKINAVHIITKYNNWYQDEGIAHALESVKAISILYKNIVSYGASMGGYAAIRFGFTVGANKVIAISPQYSINPLICEFEDRWSEAKKINFIKESEKLKQVDKIYAIYDPADKKDKLQINRIKEDVEIEEIKLHHAGHSAALFLSEIGILSELILSMVHGDFDMDIINHKVTTKKRSSAKYFSTVSKRLARKNHLILSIKMAKKANELNPSNSKYVSDASMLIAMSGDIGDATYWARNALSMSPENLEYSTRLADLLLKIGNYGEVVELCKKYTKTNTSQTIFYLQMAIAYKNLNMNKEAYQSAAKAFRREPENELYKIVLLECVKGIFP